MYILVLTGVASLLIVLVVTPICRNLFLRFGVVDQPDQDRKLHSRAVPRVGGIPVALAYIIPFGILLLLPSRETTLLTAQLPFRWELPVGAAVVFAAGLLDDIYGLKPWKKLLVQFGTAALACWGGVRIVGVHGYYMAPWLTVLVTLIWLVGCSNAFNLIDGVDGLASGVGFFATVTMLLSGILQHNLVLTFLTLPLAASLAGFLRYNFAPASIFLGEAGSLLVDYLLGCYAVLWSQKSATILGMMAPVNALALLLLDTALAVVRRYLR